MAIAKFVMSYTVRVDGKLAPYNHIMAETEEELIEKIRKEFNIPIYGGVDWSSDVALRAMQEGRKK